MFLYIHKDIEYAESLLRRTSMTNDFSVSKFDLHKLEKVVSLQKEIDSEYGNSNKILDGGEISIFLRVIDKLVAKGELTKQDASQINEIFGLSKSQATSTSAPITKTSKSEQNSDKRPAAPKNLRDWANGHYKNVKILERGLNYLVFETSEPTMDGDEKIKVTVVKTDDGRSIISKDRFGEGVEVSYYELDNKTGKILSKHSRTGADLPQRMVCNEDGTCETDDVSLEEMLNKEKKGTSDIKSWPATESLNGDSEATKKVIREVHW